MEIYVILGIVFVAIILWKLIASNLSNKRKSPKDKVYSYTAKSLVMTETEKEFFTKLDRVMGDRYYVFPKVHLSALLEHKVRDQNWPLAFQHINDKSVDFLLCDRENLRPVYAIDFDDLTHNDLYERRKQDTEASKVFKEANLPLVLFSNKDVPESEIKQVLSNAKKL